MSLMDSEAEVLEISSDEDGVEFRGRDAPYSDLMRELFQDDEPWDSDVVVMSELSCAAVSPKMDYVSPKKPKSVVEVLDDDDCVILDGDPDEPVVVEKDNDKVDGSDDLLIVAEKGQLACRDYPHPRHLCSLFPFSTKSHAKYCEKCHCYVCDSLAPCVLWGSGTSPADHCHATDKEERWKLQRNTAKQKVADVSASRTQFVNLPTNTGQIPVHLANNLIPQQPVVHTFHDFPDTNFDSPVMTQKHHWNATLHYEQRVLSRHPNGVSRNPPLHGTQRDRQARIFPRVCSNPNFKRQGSSKNAFVTAHVNRHPQHVTTQTQVSRMPVQMTYTPVVRPHQSHGPPATTANKNQYPEIPPLGNGNLLRYQDILASLESELGISKRENSSDLPCTVPTQIELYDHAFSLNVNQNQGVGHIPAPQPNISSVSVCQPYIVPPQPVLCSPSLSQDSRNSDLNAVWSSPSRLNGPLPENEASQSADSYSLPEQQKILPTALTKNIEPEAVRPGDWVSFLTRASIDIPIDPSMPLGFHSAEPLLKFDFEETMG